jgi:hypothetical protein
MRVAFLALLLLAACDQSPATSSAPERAPQTSTAPSSPEHSASTVEGWETSREAYAKLGTTAPDFSFAPPGGGLQVTHEALRGRWTILGFQTAGDSPGEEARYVSSLSTAADQDPDLDFLAIPDDAKIATDFSITMKPAYLLIGPDLTIEAYRGALSATPEDGIKPVIRGVAEIKRQIAAPQ